jgi:hypothetical protein
VEVLEPALSGLQQLQTLHAALHIDRNKAISFRGDLNTNNQLLSSKRICTSFSSERSGAEILWEEGVQNT